MFLSLFSFSFLSSRTELADKTRPQLQGSIAAMSTIMMPSLLSSPASADVLAKQWLQGFTRGKALGPSLAGLSLAVYSYLAYDARAKGDAKWLAWAAAGVLTISIVPFTLVFMDTTNQALIAAATGGSSKSLASGATSELVTKWKHLNLVRSVLPLTGTVVGFYGLLHSSNSL